MFNVIDTVEEGPIIELGAKTRYTLTPKPAGAIEPGGFRAPLPASSEKRTMAATENKQPGIMMSLPSWWPIALIAVGAYFLLKK